MNTNKYQLIPIRRNPATRQLIGELQRLMRAETEGRKVPLVDVVHTAIREAVDRRKKGGEKP